MGQNGRQATTGNGYLWGLTGVYKRFKGVQESSQGIVGQDLRFPGKPLLANRLKANRLKDNRLNADSLKTHSGRVA